jgi:glycosyltransferase domain-containing protein
MPMASISKNKKGLLSEITVIIFSRNRPSELIRSIQYWSNLNVNCLVLDNSPNELAEIPLSPLISYLYCPNLNFSQRSLIATEFIKNKYSIICSDDERYTPSALESMIKELNSNSEILSVGGHAIAVGKYGPLVYGKFAYSQMLQYENLDSNKLNRLEKHFGQQELVWPIGAMYRIIRSESMKKLLTMFYHCQSISTPYIYEVTSEIVVTALGKSRYLDFIFWIRNWQTPAINQADWDRKLHFTQWWENKKYVDEKVRWVDNLAREIFSTQGRNEIQEIFDSVVRLRKTTEKLPTADSNFLIKNDYLKYYFRRIFTPKLLPKKVEDVLLDTSSVGVTSDFHEVEFGLASIFK